MSLRTFVPRPALLLGFPIHGIETMQIQGQLVGDDRGTAFPSRCQVLLFAAAAVVIPLSYSLYTNHLWEDFYITFRHSRNLCEGKGLLYNPPERVHGFTSPLGVLLPALLYYITGSASHLPAVWLFRILSIFAYAGAGVLVLLSATREGAGPRASAVFLGLFFLAQVKAVEFTINGMETAFMLLFLAWGIFLLGRPIRQNWPWWGLVCSGLMWTRPDGCIYIASLATVRLVFCGENRADVVRAMPRIAGLCTALYLPWFVWAWAYYGSPVPHTITAKFPHGQTHAAYYLGQLMSLYRIFPLRAAEVFDPIYYHFGGWPKWIRWASYVFGSFCAFYWVVPVEDSFGRKLSALYALLCLYLSMVVGPAPWYAPPVGLCGAAVLSRGPFALASLWGKGGPRAQLLATVACLLVGAEMGYIFGMTASQMRIRQHEIEDGNRVKIGNWLRENTRPGDTVFLECLGYIGYFSERHIVEMPGLVTPRIVALSRERRFGPESVINEIEPDWMVLRPWEADEMGKAEEFLSRYDFVRSFNVQENLKKYGTIPGFHYLLIDSSFGVYRRRQ